MQNRIQKAEYRHTAVCVDAYERSIIQGRLYGPYIDKEAEFYGLMDFILQMEAALEKMNLPQSGSAIRSFFSPQDAESASGGLPEPPRKTGRAATFLIRILFRQNSSWQGSILWLEGKSEQSFRSVLELVLLMDSALTAERRTAP